MTTPAFWTATAERATRTFAQAALAVLGAGSFGLLDAPWTAALSAAGMAALLSVLTSLATAHTGPAGPGLAETVQGRHPRQEAAP